MRRICAASVIAAASSFPSHAQVAGAFESARWIPLPGSASESVAADLDGDGDQDFVAVLFQAPRRIAVLRNRGDGSFEPPELYATAIWPHQLACADFNGDGRVDIFVLDEDPTAAHVYTNLGNGTFAPSVGFAVGYEPPAAAVADYDGDARPDVALLTRASYDAPDELWIAWNDGHGGLGSTSTIGSSPVGLTGMRSADVDGDGDQDLVVIATGRLYVMRNRGDRTFESLPSVDAGSDAAQLDLGDHDGDGDVDALLTRIQVNASTVWLARNLGGGVFGSPVLLASFHHAPQLAVDDWDGDQRLDFLVHDTYLNQLQMFRGRGDATFEAPRAYALEGAFESLTAIDLEGDGDKDVMCVTNGLVVATNRGQGRFDAEEGWGGNLAAVEGADLDGDGDLDLVSRGGAMWIHRNLGSGVYASGAWLAGSNGNVGCLADLDVDGDVDIAGIREAGQDLGVWTNQGNGTFDGPVRTVLPGFPRLFASGDVDADGDVDFVVALRNATPSPLEYEALVMRNRGDGTFEFGDHFDTGTIAAWLELADVDGDGDLDVALATDPATPWFARNDGSGRFDALQPAPLPARAARLVDLDSDGHVDVLADVLPTAVVYVRNRGDGTFEPARTIWSSTSIPAAHLAALDVDGDGDVDLTSGLYVLENAGDETFTVVDRLYGSSIGLPFTGDVDGDEDDDVVLLRGLRVIRNGAHTGTAVALGDGSGAPCPCGNSGAPGRGCANSVDVRGAELRASGNARLAKDTLVLQASGATHGTALWLQGTQSANGGLGAPFGDGLLGVAGSIRRLATTITSAGSASFPIGNARPLSALGGVVAPGTRTYQLLYRDVAGLCAPSSFNLTNALSVVWIP